MKMNKKVMTGLIVGAALLTGTTALAAGNGGRFMQEYNAQNTAVVCDADGDGICDVTGSPVHTGDCNGDGNCVSTAAQNSEAPAENPGNIRASSQNKGGNGCGYGDTNGDGICDVTGNPVGQGCQNGSPKAYGDIDGDGICDRSGNSVGEGRHHGGGRQGNGQHCQ
ncbi:hypothetical protein ACH52_3319 [Eubacterium limosum]|nr:hypothetical protein ACH52_3319 [Eubacterium limosum]